MNNNNKVIPIITYNNLENKKYIIYNDNRNRSGIYRINNIITGESYIGSSMSLTKRFRTYYSLITMQNHLNKGLSAIYSALIKHGYSNFSLDILEYCEPDIIITREQYYMDILKPKYNILKKAGSRLGCKHSEAAKIKMKSRIRIYSDSS